MMRCFLLTDNINGMDLCVATIEVYFYHLISHMGQEYFHIQKSVLYVEKSAVSQVIIPIKSVITRKRSLMTTISSIKHDQVMGKTYNAGSRSMKVLTLMKI